MNLAARAALLAVVCLPARAQTTPQVGSGQIDLSTQWAFSAAYMRGGFVNLVSLPPIGDVRRFGATGLVQEFRDAARTENVRLGLVKANAAVPGRADGSDVFQVRAPLFNYYTTVGPNTAGYPTTDSQSCPSAPACIWAIFDKNYALFAYVQPLLAGENFTVADTFFTKWTAAGGIGGLGPATSAEQNVTSARSGAAATVQSFQSGVIFEITSGAQNGRMFAVGPTVYPLYNANSGYGGFLGFPTSEELLQPGGMRRQSFEGGAIEYSPGGQPALRLPVAGITWLAGAASFRLQLGETLVLQVGTYDAAGAELTGRTVNFASSNTRVVALEPRGAFVTLRAVGGGTATVTAVSEGRSSPPVTIFVTAPCCAAGEGTPTAALQSAFEQAITRNQLALRLPAAAPARRIGAGYVQEFQAADADGARYLIAVGDRIGVAYAVSGEILERYSALGGPAGTLGFPTGDASSGRQLFEGGALAGSPARQVTGAVLAKWAGQGYERGPAGMPSGEAETVLSSFATTGHVQPFQNGMIVAAGAKAYFVTAAAAAAWQQAGAFRSALGLPVSDEFAVGTQRQQEFEGGTIQYTPGSTGARVTERPRRPATAASPATVPAGSRVRLSFSGFTPGMPVRVSVSGRPDFFVTSESGAHTWEAWVPATAPSATVAVRATTDAGIIALTTYNVRSRAETRIKLAAVAGDVQTGAPAAALPQAFRIRATDDAGTPVAGLPVLWTPSPGAALISFDEVTNDRGEAEARLRMPGGESIALATAEAGRQVVTFSARAARVTLVNFPRFTDASPGGAMLAAVASIIRYWQNRGDLGSANGSADPAALRQFLESVCGFDAAGNRSCDGFVALPNSNEQFVNLWRLSQFGRGGIAVNILVPDMTAVRDAVAAQGTPVLLAVPANTATRFLVATGIEANGRLVIHDPSPANAPAWDGRIAAAVTLTPRGTSMSGIVVRSSDPVTVLPASGSCTTATEWQAGGRAFRQQACTVDAREYQIELPGAASTAGVSDVAAAGGQTEISGAAAMTWSVTRSQGALQVRPQTVRFESAAVVNAASFQPGIAPGAIAAVFGSGLARQGAETQLHFGNLPSTVLSATPFQLNFVVPSELAAGEHNMRVVAPAGAAEHRIKLEPVAPAVFIVEGRRGAVLNLDGGLNAPTRPVLRGSAVSVYGTGFASDLPVTATLNGREVPVMWAGPAPGFTGLIQVNVSIPESLAPDLRLQLVLRQGGRETSLVEMAVE